MKLCDLHTHVLPGVDDGASTMECALEMIQNAIASDVELLALTPHCNIPYSGGNYLDQDLKERFAQLKETAKDLPIQLVLGAEVRANDQLLPNLAQGKIPTINDGRYLLTEFSPDTKDFEEMLRQILDLGYIPLIAHPERYIAVYKNPGIVMPWLDMGCHLQLTAGSVLGEYGKTVQRASASLLKQGLVACLASDAHGLHHRTNFLLDAYTHLSVQYSKQYAQCLLYENPMRICHNDNL